jgi:hypothetical protein
MVSHGQFRAALAREGVVLVSMASALINLAIIHRNAKKPGSVAATRGADRCSVIGIGVLVLQGYLAVLQK